MKIKNIRLKKLLPILLVFLFCGVSYAQTGDEFKLKPGLPIVVDGEKVEYFEKDGKISAEGKVSIVYGEVKLTCDKIEVDTTTRQALCEGNVRIEHPDGALVGERIRYDFNSEKGEIIGAEVDAFPWFGQAEETGKVGANEYLLKNGYITTCDLDNPHYRLRAGEIRIFPDEKVIAKNVFMYIGKVPVVWFPYYYHPIIQSRAKVQLIPGHSTDWGYFLLSAWRFYLIGNTKADVIVDYRTRKGFAEGANLYYDMDDVGLSGLGEGVFRTYFIHQNDTGTYEKSAFRDEGLEPVLRDRFQLKHRIDFEPGTVGMAEFNKLSDRDLLKDYLYNEYAETEQVPRNYVSLSSAQSNYIFRVEANKRIDDFYTVTQKLPEVAIDVPSQRLWDTPFYYGAVSSATAFNKVYEEGSENGEEEVIRADSEQKLSYVTGIGPLRLMPYGLARGTTYSREKWESADPVARAAIGGGLDASSRFFRIYNYNTDILGLDVNGLRHIIAPGAKYFHLHQPTVDKNNLYQMDEIDSLEKENFVTLSLENKLQTKRHSGDELQTVDLMRFLVSTDYNFRMEKQRVSFEEVYGFEDITFDAEVRPYEWLFLNGEINMIPDNQSIRDSYVEFAIQPTDSFLMNFGYRYEKMTPESRNQFIFDTQYVINPKWKIGLYERLNFEQGNIEEQQVSITRDLHCWEVEVVYDVDGANFFKDDFTFWLAFKIKAFPDLQLGLSRSFKKHIPGNMRGSSELAAVQ